MDSLKVRKSTFMYEFGGPKGLEVDCLRSWTVPKTKSGRVSGLKLSGLNTSKCMVLRDESGLYKGIKVVKIGFGRYGVHPTRTQLTAMFYYKKYLYTMYTDVYTYVAVNVFLYVFPVARIRNRTSAYLSR